VIELVGTEKLKNEKVPLSKHEKYISEAKTRENSGQLAEDAKKATKPRLEINIMETVVEKFFIEGQIFT
jgi:hypothetical protein